MSGTLVAGAATADITPADSQFLFGYPHVERYSTGVHDPLLSSALYLCDERTGVMFISNDIIYVHKDAADRTRRRISEATTIPAGNVMVTATHTHSGPITAKPISGESDPVVPEADSKYGRFMEDGIVNAAVRAWQAAQPAELGLTIANGRGVGTNRRSPEGPADPEVPVLMVRSADGTRNLACMVICSMHPTVLHEDSTLVSADFPGMARMHLQETVLGRDCPVIYHTGPCGNQSPRHVTRGNTFAEAKRLGGILGKAIADVIPSTQFRADCRLRSTQAFLDLPHRAFPPVAQAEARLNGAVERLARMREDGSASQDVRTAECDWFGAEETLTLARAAAEGRLAAAYASCLPAEIQAITIGPWVFVGWPGEIFVEYALAVKNRCPNTYIASLANGELQGYIVTEEAAAEGGYEASNALFAPPAGAELVGGTLKLLDEK